MNVESILSSKGRSAVTVTPESRIDTAVALMRRHGIGALIVSRDGAAVEGVLSERDIVYALGERGQDILRLEVRQLMTSPVITCKPEDSVADLMALMTDKRIRHIPVVVRGALAGIVSIGDVVKNRLDEVENEAKSMRAFITGT